MKILFDECVNSRLARHLPGHFVRTAPQMGWSAIKNGHLLALAEQQFEVFLTMDRNLVYQQHLPRFRIAVLVLRSPSNRLEDLLSLVPEILVTIPQLQPGQVVTIGA